MSNIADLIETYILQQLCNEKKRDVILKRADIADAINCAPSQISYVLSTRFTVEKGFLVESRRGLGGFIRIERRPAQNLIYLELAGKITDDFSQTDLHHLLTYMLRHELITRRETTILAQTFALLEDKMATSERSKWLRSTLKSLSDMTDGKDTQAQK